MVMVFASMLAFVLSLTVFRTNGMIGIMGGIRGNERDALLLTSAALGCQLSVCTFPFWAICLLYAARASTPVWRVEARRDGVGYLPWLAAASLLVWALVLPWTQPPQSRRRAVERLFAGGRIAEGLAELSRHERADYPPGWEPPPRGFRIPIGMARGESILDVLEEMVKDAPADWVREDYLTRLPRLLEEVRYSQLDDESSRRLAAALQGIPGGVGVVDELELKAGRGMEEITAELRRHIEGRRRDDDKKE
jgi:hypothetical protein